MSEDVARALGISAQMTMALAKLAHQIKAQGGQEEDVRLLERDDVVSEVAIVLARAGNLSRPYHIRAIGKSNDKTLEYVDRDLFLIGLMLESIADATQAVNHYGCRLAHKHELHDFWQRNSSIGSELLIIGEMIGESDDGLLRKHAVICGGEVREIMIPIDSAIENNVRFAVIFK